MVRIEPPEPLKVQWNEHDASPVPTVNPVRVIQIRSHENDRIIRVMKTADNPEYLIIYVDVV